VRFLIDVTVNRPQPARHWDWGNLETLPFLPRVRYGRTVLTQARWLPDHTLYDSADLPSREWADRFTMWRQRWRASGYQGGTALLAQDEKTMLNELLRIVV